MYSEIEPVVIYEAHPQCYGGYHNDNADDHGSSNCRDDYGNTTEGDVY